MVGFIPKGVTEHLSDAGKFVLAGEAKNHAKQTVELCTFHALPKKKNIFCKLLFVG